MDMSELSLDDALKIYDFLSQFSDHSDFSYRLGGILMALAIEKKLDMDEMQEGRNSFVDVLKRFANKKQLMN
jgi:hypothetical protein